LRTTNVRSNCIWPVAKNRSSNIRRMWLPILSVWHRLQKLTTSSSNPARSKLRGPLGCTHHSWSLRLVTSFEQQIVDQDFCIWRQMQISASGTRFHRNPIKTIVVLHFCETNQSSGCECEVPCRATSLTSRSPFTYVGPLFVDAPLYNRTIVQSKFQ
jgi:hypothetical protein